MDKRNFVSAVELRDILNDLTEDQLKDLHVSCVYSDDIAPGDVEGIIFPDGDLLCLELIGSAECV